MSNISDRKALLEAKLDKWHNLEDSIREEQQYLIAVDEAVEEVIHFVEKSLKYHNIGFSREDLLTAALEYIKEHG